jgi:hypothetical protein
MNVAKKTLGIFKDMLTEKGKYSQGRVYLLWSVVAYYVTLGVLLFAGIQKSEIDIERFQMILDALEYAMTLFGGYVFGGKFISAYKAVSGKDETKQNEEL